MERKADADRTAEIEREQRSAGAACRLQRLVLLGQNEPAAEREAAQVAGDLDYAAFHPAVLSVQELTDTEDPSKTLVLCCDPAMAQTLQQAGWAVAGWIPAGSSGADFPGLLYVLSEITRQDPDTYEKVYERLRGLPWTILLTERCCVRELCSGDLPGLYRLYEDPAAKRFLEGPGADTAKEQSILEAYIRRVYSLYGYGYWAVTDRDSGELIGKVGFETYQAGAAAVSFGFLIREDCRGQGLAAEVCRAVLKFAQENLDFPGIDAWTDRENTAAQTLLRRLGFRQQGIRGTMERWIL